MGRPKKKEPAPSGAAPDEPTTIKLTTEQKDWLLTKYAGFLDAKANRGTKLLPNGQKFVTTDVVPKFMSKWYANLSDQERKDIFARADYVCSLLFRAWLKL